MSSGIPTSKVVIVIFLIGIVGSGYLLSQYVLDGGLDPDSPFSNDAYYYETVNITISFAIETEFSLLLPEIQADNSTTPVLADLSLINAKIVQNVTLQWVVINDTDWLQISGKTKEFQIFHKVELPDKKGSRIAYEDFLFSHEVESSGETSDNRTSNSTIILDADRGMGFDFKIAGVTNLCSGDFQLQFDEPELRPGSNHIQIFDEGFVYICA